MKRIDALLVTVILLSGCATTAQQHKLRQEEAHRKADLIWEECKQRHVAGELKTYVEKFKCSQDRVRQVYIDYGFSYMDLLDLMAAYQMALGERIDKGELSLAQAEVQMAEVRTRVTSEMEKRNRAGNQEQLQSQQVRQQAWQDALKMLNDNMQRQQDRDALMAPRTMAPITCQQFGAMIRCY